MAQKELRSYTRPFKVASKSPTKSMKDPVNIPKHSKISVPYSDSRCHHRLSSTSQRRIWSNQSLLSRCHPLCKLNEDKTSWLLWLLWFDHQQSIPGFKRLQGWWGIRFKALHHGKVSGKVDSIHISIRWWKNVRRLPQSTASSSSVLQGFCSGLRGCSSETSLHLFTLFAKSFPWHAVRWVPFLKIMSHLMNNN